MITHYHKARIGLFSWLLLLLEFELLSVLAVSLLELEVSLVALELLLLPLVSCVVLEELFVVSVEALL